MKNTKKISYIKTLQTYIGENVAPYTITLASSKEHFRSEPLLTGLDWTALDASAPTTV